MTEVRPEVVRDEDFAGLAGGRRVGVLRLARDAGWTTRKLKVFGRVEAALVGSPGGESAGFAIPDGAVAVGLHLSAPNPNAFRYEGERWREYVEGRGASSVIVPGRPFEQIGGAPSEDLHVLLPGELMQSVGDELGVTTRQLEFISALAVHDDTMGRLLGALKDEVAGGGPGGRLYAEGLASALAVHLLRCYSSLGDGLRREVVAGPGAAGVSKKTMSRALEYIGYNLVSDLSLADIARAANLSERHLYRLFRETVGLSPHQYVIRERVERAKGLLRETDLTIAEVAVSSGFSHHQHLNRHFKGLTGASPERFRREGRR